jgi:2'-5' RNA ligase
VDLATGGRPAFDVSLAGAGAFPDTRRPRALWLGIERGAGELGDLARRLDDALVPLGWPPDARAYRPHLTVARLDAAPRADGIAAVEELIGAAAGWRTSFRAHEVVLFRSHLGRGPARHEALHRVPLRA